MSRISFAALAILSIPASVSADIAGCWISAAGNSVIEMYVEEDVVTGRIVGMNDPVFLAEEGRGTCARQGRRRREQEGGEMSTTAGMSEMEWTARASTIRTAGFSLYQL